MDRVMVSMPVSASEELKPGDEFLFVEPTSVCHGVAYIKLPRGTQARRKSGYDTIELAGRERVIILV